MQIEAKNAYAISPGLSIPPNAHGTDFISEGYQMPGYEIDEEDLLRKQSLRYAEDLARVYALEQARQKDWERVNKQLKCEEAARMRAEKELQKERRRLEKRVRERTRELSDAAAQLAREARLWKLAEAHARAELEKKEGLLSEVHHRTKASLQIASSLLALQNRLLEDQRAIDALNDTRDRIRSIALIHDQLDQTDGSAGIDFSAHIQELVSGLVRTYGEHAPFASVNTHVDRCFLSMEAALPCSLIINELVKNSLRHAFSDGRSGEIDVEFRQIEQDRYRLTVVDTGRGMADDLDWRNCTSLGLRLVINLTEQQLRGKLDLSTTGETRFVIEFKDTGKDRTVRCGHEAEHHPPIS